MEWRQWRGGGGAGEPAVVVLMRGEDGLGQGKIWSVLNVDSSGLLMHRTWDRITSFLWALHLSHTQAVSKALLLSSKNKDGHIAVFLMWRVVDTHFTDWDKQIHSDNTQNYNEKNSKRKILSPTVNLRSLFHQTLQETWYTQTCIRIYIQNIFIQNQDDTRSFITCLCHAIYQGHLQRIRNKSEYHPPLGGWTYPCHSLGS